MGVEQQPIKKVRQPLSAAQLILLALILCVGEVLRVANFDNVSSRTPDEKVYTHQANIWLQSGQPGLRALVEEYKANPLSQYYPPPTRVGMIRLVALAMRWTGRNDEGVGAIVSCAASIASLLVLALIAIRFLLPWAALAGALLYSVFPPELAIARRSWSDALVELFGLLLVWLTCEITRSSDRRALYLLFAAVGSVGIAIKEAMPVPYGLCGLWILWVVLRRRQWGNATLVTSAGIVGLAVTLWWLGRAVGSVSEVIAIVTSIQKVNAANPYALEYASGPGYLLFDGFWIVSPVTTVLSAIGLYAAITQSSDPRPESKAILWLAIFTICNMLMAVLIPHWLNLRYVGVTFGPLCLLAGLGGWHLFSLLSLRLSPEHRPGLAALAAVLLLTAAATDYLRFHRIFVRHETADLSIKMLQDERG